MKYWLVKTEPETFSWEQFVAEGLAVWDGVRNYQARNFLKEMKKGDRVLFYHSVETREVVGIAEVTREHYPDPTTHDDRWVAVDMKPGYALAYPVPLSAIRKEKKLENILLIRHSRLSVMPLQKHEFEKIVAMGSEIQST